MNMVIDAGFMIWAIVDGGMGKSTAELTAADMMVLNKVC